VWISTETYEGPADLMNFFIERGKLPPTEIAARPLLDAIWPFLEELPLEERMEVLLVVAHLLWLKARALLPVLPQAESPSPEAPPSPSTDGWISADFIKVWEDLIRQAQYRLARPPAQDITPLPFLKPVTQMDLLKAYLAVQAACEKRQRRYEVQLSPLSLEIVARDLESYFASHPRTTLSALFATFPPQALYWAFGLFLILNWIQEGRLRYEPVTLWEGHLLWSAQTD